MTDLSRRTVLRGAMGGSLLLVTGCSTDILPVIGGSDPDDELRLVTAASEQQLIATYDAAIAAKPGLARPLRAIKAEHEQHLAALLQDLDDTPVPLPSAQIAEAGSLRTLRRLERGAAKQRAAACVAAEAREWVQIMALIGASEAAHVAALARLGR